MTEPTHDNGKPIPSATPETETDAPGADTTQHAVNPDYPIQPDDQAQQPDSAADPEADTDDNTKDTAADDTLAEHPTTAHQPGPAARPFDNMMKNAPPELLVSDEDQTPADDTDPNTGDSQTTDDSPPADATPPPKPQRLTPRALAAVTVAALAIMFILFMPSGEQPAVTVQPAAPAGDQTLLQPGADIDLQDLSEAERNATMQDIAGTPQPPDNPLDLPFDNLPDPEQQPDELDPFEQRLRSTREAAAMSSLTDPDFTPQSDAEQARLDALHARKIAPSIMATPANPAANPQANAPQSATNNTLPPIPENTPGPDAGFQTVQSSSDPPTQPADTTRNSPVNGVAIFQPDQDYRLLQGTALQMTMETALDSNLPGVVRALSNLPVYSANGRHLLIPARSRFIGEYTSANVGMRRLVIIWQRIITPQGIEIYLQAPGTDPLGRAGIKGKLNRRFIERFATAMIFSVINAFSRTGDNDGVSLYYDSATRDAAEIALENSVNLGPIIQIKPGAQISAQAARDIDFRQALTAFAGARITTVPDELRQYQDSDPALYTRPPLNRSADHNALILQLAEAEQQPPEHPDAPAPATPAPQDDADPPPVYLIPKAMLADPDTAARPAAPPTCPHDNPDCASITLVKSERLSSHVEDYVTRCLEKPTYWAVGGMDTWRDFIVEHTAIVPLPAGADSLNHYLQEHYQVRITQNADMVTITD